MHFAMVEVAKLNYIAATTLNHDFFFVDFGGLGTHIGKLDL